MNTLYKISLVAGTALALSACGSASPTGSAPSPGQAPVTAVTASPTESVAPAPSRSVPSSVPSSAPPGLTAASVDPCPVGERTLLTALKGTDVAHRGGDPTKLIHIKCYRGYAVAQDGAPKPGTDAAYFLFGFKRPQDVWVALTLGSGDYCQGYILDRSIKDHLGEGC
jgi:hypothetical protein